MPVERFPYYVAKVPAEQGLAVFAPAHLSLFSCLAESPAQHPAAYTLTPHQYGGARIDFINDAPTSSGGQSQEFDPARRIHAERQACHVP